jgi:hypothetical protein
MHASGRHGAPADLKRNRGQHAALLPAACCVLCTPRLGMMLPAAASWGNHAIMAPPACVGAGAAVAPPGLPAPPWRAVGGGQHHEHLPVGCHGDLRWLAGHVGGPGGHAEAATHVCAGAVPGGCPGLRAGAAACVAVSVCAWRGGKGGGGLCLRAAAAAGGGLDARLEYARWPCTCCAGRPPAVLAVCIQAWQLCSSPGLTGPCLRQP